MSQIIFTQLTFSAKFSLCIVPDLLIPYSYTDIIITILFSVPNSVTNSVQIFSLHLALRYALPMLHANISKPFKDAIRNAILTLSLDTTIDYVTDDGGAVVWPSATNIYSLVKFPSNFMLNIMCTLTCSYPGLFFLFLVSLGVISSSFSNYI